MFAQGQEGGGPLNVSMERAGTAVWGLDRGRGVEPCPSFRDFSNWMSVPGQ